MWESLVRRRLLTSHRDRSHGMRRPVSAAVGVAWLIAIGACTVPDLPVGGASAGVDCTRVSDLFPAEEALNDPEHACHDWIDRVHGRVARSGSASAVVWTRRTEHGTAVMTSAVHTLDVGFLGPGGTDLPEQLRNPADEIGTPRITLIESDGVALDDRVSPMFLLYTPGIPVAENGDGFRDIPPVHDFYLAVLDSQKLDTEPALEVPQPLNNEAPAIYDPANDTTTATTFADGEAGDLVLLLGYPSGSGFAGRLAVGVGEVLGDTDAVDAVEALRDAGDEEGDIAYRADVEMFIEGVAVGGMSGGGVFDDRGKLVGVIVRATEATDLPRYVRAVRMTYVVTELRDAFDALDAMQRDAVQMYVETFR